MTTVILFFSLLMFQQTTHLNEATSITVVVENLQSSEGTLIVSLSSEETFMKAKPEYTLTSKISNGKATVTFENIGPGFYGITVVHDENDNSRMDFDSSGMPTENYGISNNKINPYGPPVWSDAKFEVNGQPLEFNIKLTR
ncbi:DUF2141 domain-containing protein [Antarcticibacterium sp. 1MA-6-2]|uniref:DUF2141 domain-containing protein n=1 Tax=Antarcticibacterium sp. 1MA-6-2 TaxID=2908210 RepID=UPI001F398F83|nr:DUF2141 domain-containing protein [Antarcticibacterium sp. 1MA-6-2]UJH92023.1 DUF2141 domain-containing protein [Antarcticibacterium sp. 1MA-6-2]